MKEIDFQLLAQINVYQTRIWNEEGDDYPDYRKIRNYERAIDNRFAKMGADKQMQKDIEDTFCMLDWTYKEQCDRLRALGYVIVNNGRKPEE